MLSESDKKARRGFITGSRIAAIAGLSPYATALDVFREIVEGYEQPESPPMVRGRHLESSILSWYREETGADLQKVEFTGHPLHEHIGATPDAIATMPDGTKRIVEAKSVSFRLGEQWGNAGTDQIPTHYMPQVQFEMGCTGLMLADVPALFGGEELRIYTVKFDPELFGMLVETAERFWKDHIIPKVPPPLDGSESWADYLGAKFPRHEDVCLSATPDAEQWAKALFTARNMATEAKALETEAQNHLKQAMGTADKLMGDGWKITWRTGKDGASTDWEAVARGLTFPTNQPLVDSLVAKHTKLKPGARSFRPTLSKGENNE